MTSVRSKLILALCVAIWGQLCLGTAVAQHTDPAWLRDRGHAVPASLFGTYIHPGELVVYPFVEYVTDHDREYQPNEFGVGPDVDFRGEFESKAAQLFLGYGVNDWLALEFEIAYLSAEFEKSPGDTFPTPATVEESGLTDIEGQVRARVRRESAGWPEVFAYAEIVAPSQTSKVLIDEPDFDVKPGVGFIKGFSFGTLTGRINLEYNHEEKKVDLGELSIEYLKRLSPNFRLFLAFEGGETGALDEWGTVQGIQWRIGRSLFLKIDSEIGISSKATDWAPQVGIMWAPRW